MNIPTQGEYPPYYQSYINLVPEKDILQVLKDNLDEATKLFEGISDADANYRYAPEKWSVKEVLGHISDTERIMSYRLLRISRGDRTPLAGFDENQYVKESNFNNLSMETLLNDFSATRNATISLLTTTSEAALRKTGVANGAEVTANAIAYIIAGHEMHHRKIVTERYLK